MRKSGSPEQCFQEEKKEKAYTIHYLKLPELEREEGPFIGRIKKYMPLLRKKLDECHRLTVIKWHYGK